MAQLRPLRLTPDGRGYDDFVVLTPEAVGHGIVQELSPLQRLRSRRLCRARLSYSDGDGRKWAAHVVARKGSKFKVGMDPVKFP